MVAREPHDPRSPDAHGRDSRPPGIEKACREHLEFVRKHCPGLLPSGPVPPGEQIEPIPVDAERATALVRTALARQAPGDRAVVWADGTDTLLVLLDDVRVDTHDGLVTVGLDVACDQARSVAGDLRSHVEIDLVVGTPDRPTGLLAAATEPRGPAVVVDRWRDPLVAMAWQALLDTAAGLAAAAGADPDGTALVPTGWSASRAGLEVGAQARHPFDRLVATSSGGAVGPRTPG